MLKISCFAKSYYRNQKLKNFFIDNRLTDTNNNKKLSKKFYSNTAIINEIKNIPSKIEITKPIVYIAKSNNIIFNLSTEEFFYEYQNIKKPILFLYQNDTNVVIGKHQNPWKECKITNMHQNNVK